MPMLVLDNVGTSEVGVRLCFFEPSWITVNWFDELLKYTANYKILLFVVLGKKNKAQE